MNFVKRQIKRMDLQWQIWRTEQKLKTAMRKQDRDTARHAWSHLIELISQRTEHDIISMEKKRGLRRG